jgi:hypothetical protein
LQLQLPTPCNSGGSNPASNGFLQKM